MNKILIAIVLLISVVGTSHAESRPNEQDYRDLDELRAKIIRMRQEMNKFVKDVAGTDMGKGGTGVFGQDVRVDVTENDKFVIVRADLPGMSKDKIEVVLEKEKMLKISGSREVVSKQESPGVVRQERMSGSFERTLELPSECESQDISATYKEGVLEIVLQKKKASKEEVVRINVK